MAKGKFVSYLRVSTDKQGRSGLGLEAQREAVRAWLDGGRWQLVAEFVEVESGRRDDRPELEKALAACRIYGATLVVAKLDRLTRSVSFLSTLRDSGVEFVAVDLPNANRAMVTIWVAIAEYEREACSARTKAALAAARARGVRLGHPETFTDAGRAVGRRKAAARRAARIAQRATDLAPTVADLQNTNGARTLQGLADGLNARGIPATRGGAWSTAQVWRLLRAINAHKES